MSSLSNRVASRFLAAIRKRVAAPGQSGTEFDPDHHHYKAKLTTYDGMNDASGLLGYEGNEVWSHLLASPNNAVVFEWSSGPSAFHAAVWNAGDRYAVAKLPLEDPNDAEFVDRDPGLVVEALDELSASD